MKESSLLGKFFSMIEKVAVSIDDSEAMCSDCSRDPTPWQRCTSVWSLIPCVHCRTIFSHPTEGRSHANNLWISSCVRTIPLRSNAFQTAHRLVDKEGVSAVSFMKSKLSSKMLIQILIWRLTLNRFHLSLDSIFSMIFSLSEGSISSAWRNHFRADSLYCCINWSLSSTSRKAEYNLKAIRAAL